MISPKSKNIFKKISNFVIIDFKPLYYNKILQLYTYLDFRKIFLTIFLKNFDEKLVALVFSNFV